MVPAVPTASESCVTPGFLMLSLVRQPCLRYQSPRRLYVAHLERGLNRNDHFNGVDESHYSTCRG
jgi:hypothetical protein